MTSSAAETVVRSEALVTLLMAEHPSLGARRLAGALREPWPFKTGWNVIPAAGDDDTDEWVLVADDGTERLRTHNRPPGATDAHEVDETPPARTTTTAWKWLERFAGTLDDVEFSTLTERLADIWDNQDTDDPADVELAPDMVVKRQEGLPEAISELVVAQLDHRINGAVAVPMLTSMLWEFGIRSGFDPDGWFVAVRRHLQKRTNQIVTQTPTDQLSRLRMTSLAHLYSQLGLEISRRLRGTEQLDPEVEEELDRLDHTLVELLEHRIRPFMVYRSLPRARLIGLISQNELDTWAIEPATIADDPVSTEAIEHEYTLAHLLKDQAPAPDTQPWIDPIDDGRRPYANWAHSHESGRTA